MYSEQQRKGATMRHEENRNPASGESLSTWMTPKLTRLEAGDAELNVGVTDDGVDFS
jgi:hypothetical protein